MERKKSFLDPQESSVLSIFGTGNLPNVEYFDGWLAVTLTTSTQNGLAKGAIAGIAVGAAAFTAILVGAIMFLILPRRRVVIARTRKASCNSHSWKLFPEFLA